MVTLRDKPADESRLASNAFHAMIAQDMSYMQMVREMERSSTVTPEQYLLLARRIQEGKINRWNMQAILDAHCPMDIASQLERWRIFLFTQFNIAIEVDEVVVPVHKPGFFDFSRLIIVPAGLTVNQVVKWYSNRFALNVHDLDFDSLIAHNDRTNTQTYAIFVRNNLRVDGKEGLAGGQTLLEYLLHAGIQHHETYDHLDIDSCTLCTGTIEHDGEIAFARRIVSGHRIVVEIGWVGKTIRQNETCSARQVLVA